MMKAWHGYVQNLDPRWRNKFAIALLMPTRKVKFELLSPVVRQGIGKKLGYFGRVLATWRHIFETIHLQLIPVKWRKCFKVKPSCHRASKFRRLHSQPTKIFASCSSKVKTFSSASLLLLLFCQTLFIKVLILKFATLAKKKVLEEKRFLLVIVVWTLAPF